MILKLLKPFKSIRSLDAFELPDFVVLTGVNGAGKSHLLEAIENGSIVIDGVPPNTPHGQKFIRRFDANTLVTQDTGAFSGSQISQEVAAMWDQLQQTWKAHFEDFYTPLRQFPFGDVEKYTPQDLMQFDDTKLMSMGFSQDAATNAVQTINAQINQCNAILMQQFIAQDPQNRPRLIERLVSGFTKPFFTISQDEFYERFPDNWQQIDLFQQSFSRMFSAYQRAWRDNELRIRGRELGAPITPLTQEEFVQKYGIPPWDFLNNILQIANLDFRINHPPRWEDRPYEPLLKDPKRGIEVKFADLSSGERVLMSFALCLYHVNDSRANIEYPRVLLFDEIDAPLHPSMTNSLLKTIQQSLVVDRAIKVILTTHSPSTVALSPETAIFVMHKAGAQRITTGSKDAALGILTSGVRL